MLFEIVPNLSEGRDAATIDAAIAAVEATGARVLNRSSDAVHHRSVLTIAGSETAILDASVALAGVALERIDLRNHSGVHPRIGALDVLPFVPLRGATLADAAALAHRAGAEIWRRYGVPSYYYGAAARAPERRLLPAIRRNTDWLPDEGGVCPPCERRSNCDWRSRRPHRIQYRAGYHRSSSGPDDCSSDSRTRRRPTLAARACLAAQRRSRAGLAQHYGLCCNAALSRRGTGSRPRRRTRNRSARLRAYRLPSPGRGRGCRRILFGSHDALRFFYAACPERSRAKRGVVEGLLALLLGLCAPQAAPGAKRSRAMPESSRRRCATGCESSSSRIERLRSSKRACGTVSARCKRRRARPAWRTRSNT